MAARLARRGSTALSMLDESISSSLGSVLTDVNPPSHDSVLQVVDSLVSSAVWEKHRQTLDEIARACAARDAMAGLKGALGMSNEFMKKDNGECGLPTTDLEGDQPAPSDIDARARGRIGRHPLSVAPFCDGLSDYDEISEIGSFASSSSESGGSTLLPGRQSYAGASVRSLREAFPTAAAPASAGTRRPPDRGETEAMVEIPLPCALNVKTGKALGGSVADGLTSRHDPGRQGQATSRSDARSVASSIRSLMQPAMARLFKMADRRSAGWLNVTDMQVFLEYHGHKKWANPNIIRNILTDLNISKAGNDPIKQSHFVRFLLHLLQKDPLIEFAACPLPPDELMIGVPEQAKELAAILKETSDHDHTKPPAAKRRLQRALTSAAAGGGLLNPSNARPAPLPGGARAGDAEAGGAQGDALGDGWDASSHQVALQVDIRDVAAARRPSTAPAPASGSARRRSLPGQKKRRDSARKGARADARLARRQPDHPGRGKKGLEAFLSLDHSVQASMIEVAMDVRPGVIVQEVSYSEGDAGGPGEARPVRSREGPAELQVPGRLSWSAYKALSRTSVALKLPVGQARPSTAAGGSREREGTKDALPKVVGISGQAGKREKGTRPSTAPGGPTGVFGMPNGPDPRLLGGSRVSRGFDGGDVGPEDANGIGSDGPGSLSVPSTGKRGLETLQAYSGGAPREDQDGTPPLFVGENVGCSTVLGGAKGAEANTLVPRGMRSGSPVSGASRARISSPGLGARGGGRGGRAVAAW